MYSWVLAGGFSLLRLSPQYEFAVAHVVNFVAFLVVLASFEFLLRGIRACLGDEHEPVSPADGAYIALSYSIFIWCTVGLVGLGRLTPDLLLTAVAFSIAGLLARLRTQASLKLTALLGVACGLGFLTKSVFLPLTVVILITGAFLQPSVAYLKRFLIVGPTAFAIVIAPYVLALSRAKDRLTFGDTGRVVYGWLVTGVPGVVHWQGGQGEPQHPTRQIASSPDVFEFGGPLHATYPPWYDPSYWYEGVDPQMNVWLQIKVVLNHLPMLLDLLAPLMIFLIVGIFSSDRPRTATSYFLRHTWWLLVLPVAALALYSAVLVETRYVGPFMALLWLAGIAGISGIVSSRVFRALAFASATVLLLFTIPMLAPFPRAILPSHRNVHWEYSQELMKLGLAPGESIAMVGDAIFEYWPRLAGVRIAVEIPAREARDFWTMQGPDRVHLVNTISRYGVSTVVAKDPPTFLSSEGWRFTADRQYALLRLASQ